MVLGLFGTMFNVSRGVLEATFLAIDKPFFLHPYNIFLAIGKPFLQQEPPTSINQIYHP